MIDVSESSTWARSDSGAQRIRSEHASLGLCVERLDDLLERLACGSADASDGADVLLLLDDFRQRLFAHLHREETTGVLERALVVAPHFARRVERLRHEHRDLRQLADGLVAQAGGGDWTLTRRCFVAFRDVLRAHEQGENEVLQRAYLEDLGGSG